MRLFLGIDLPQEAKDQLYNLILPLQREYKQFTWVPKENYHVTIHFIGEVETDKDIKEQMDTLFFDVPPFHMYGLEAGIFIQHKITLYTTFQRQKVLEDVVSRVRDAFGVTAQSKYVPHITIARYKIPSKQQYLLLKKKLENLEIDLNFEVNKITLFESISQHKRASYKTLAEFTLTK